MSDEQAQAEHVTSFDRERLQACLDDYRKQYAQLSEQAALARGCVLAVEAQIQYLDQQAAGPETPAFLYPEAEPVSMNGRAEP